MSFTSGILGGYMGDRDVKRSAFLAKRHLQRYDLPKVAFHCSYSRPPVTVPPNQANNHDA